jgi:Domain of unknown function (DUF4331)
MRNILFLKEKLRVFVTFLFVLGLTTVFPEMAKASDHDESPLVKTDASVDLTDLYIFDTGDEETTAIICWGGFNDSRPQPDSEAVYNANVLYTLNIDNNEDNVPDIQVFWRFAQNSAGEWGVQVENIPGSSGTVSGAVETILSAGNGTRAWAGHADEPFFFDVQGYLDTLATGTLMIRNDRSVLAGLNVTALALEMNTEAMRSGDNELRFWITSARK